MKLFDAINRFYYEMTLGELRQWNESPHQKISYNTLLYLYIISYRPSITVSELAELLQVTSPAVTTKVRELERLGLVEKKPSIKDQRIKHLVRTKSAKKEFSDYDQSLSLAVKNVEKRFTKKEIETFCQILQMIGVEFSSEREKH